MISRYLTLLVLATAVGQANADSPIYTAASPEALQAAKVMVEDFDKTMLESLQVAHSSNARVLGAQSKQFNDMVGSAKKQFPTGLFAPMRSCWVAAIHGQAWWHALLAIRTSGKSEQRNKNLDDELGQYNQYRQQCLEEADPVIAAAKAEEEPEKGKECLAVYDLDPATGKTITLPKPAHCAQQ
ncbi:hypothetical protein D3C76_578210 [compost metagenome]